MILDAPFLTLRDKVNFSMVCKVSQYGAFGGLY